jgi:hypothetical protein
METLGWGFIVGQRRRRKSMIADLAAGEREKKIAASVASSLPDPTKN